MGRHIWSIRINLDELNAFFSSLYTDHDRALGFHGLVLGCNGGKLPEEAPEPLKQAWHLSSEWRRGAEELRAKNALGGQGSARGRQRIGKTGQFGPRDLQDTSKTPGSGLQQGEARKKTFNEDISRSLPSVLPSVLEDTSEESWCQSNNPLKTISSIESALLDQEPVDITAKRKPKTVSKKKRVEANPAMPFCEDLLKAFHKMKTIYPDRRNSCQPDGKIPVPHANWPELCARLQCIMMDGLAVDICVECWRRHVEDWQQGHTWLKAPQHFFGSLPEAPWKALYQAIVTEREMEATGVCHGQ